MHSLRRIILIITAMAGLVLGVGVPKSNNSPVQAASLPTAIVRAGAVLAREGAVEACVFQYVGQGLSLAEAAKQCEVNISAAPAGVELPAQGVGSFAMDGVRNTGGGPLTVTCTSGSGADPRFADAKAARDAAKVALDAFDKGHPNPTGVDAAKRGELAQKLNEAQDALNQATVDNEARERQAAETKKMLEDAANGTKNSTAPTQPPQTQPTQPPATQPTQPPATQPPSNTSPVTTSGSAPARPVDGVDDACAEFSAFVGECNLAGWATSPCQSLRRQLRGCVDMTIAYTTGDDPNAGCPADDPDKETVAEIVELLCTSRAKVAPGYDPCGPPDLGGGPGIYEDPNADPCTGKNPYALTTREGCEVTVNESPDFGLGPTIDPTMVLILGGPGIPTTTVPLPYMKP